MALSLLDDYRKTYRMHRDEPMSLEDYLQGCRDNPGYHANAAQRLLTAIGEPEKFDTSQDSRLGRIFSNRTIYRYNPFVDFYGMEVPIEHLVGFFRHAAQGLEEKKQVLYLLGPVGGGKSSLAERLKRLMQQEPIYVLAFEGKNGLEPSPIFESPLGLFDPLSDLANKLENDCGIPKRRLSGIMSPWAAKRLRVDLEGDASRFKVIRMQPSMINQIGIAKTEPGDENNQDIASLVGRVAIRKLEQYSQHDPDAYEFSGALNRATQGLMEFVEMFKAPIKMLHPLLTATQEGNYAGTENIGMIPYQGLILAHSNEAEWQSFKSDKNNEAFIDRISVVKVPYCLRSTEEQHIFEKMIGDSELCKAPCAPKTLEMLADVTVFSRLATEYKDGKSGNMEPVPSAEFRSKVDRYNGKDLRGIDTRARTMQEYRDGGGVDEGMTGLSTRFAFKVLSQAFNYDEQEVAVDPVLLLYVLMRAIEAEQFPEEVEKRYLGFITSDITPRYAEWLEEEIKRAVLESRDKRGQEIFEEYIALADAWLEDVDYKNPKTSQLMQRDQIDAELKKIEKLGGVTQAKDFRNEVVKFVLRRRGQTGPNPAWTSYEKMRELIEAKMFAEIEDLLQVITPGAKKDSDTEVKHDEFVMRMIERSYTERQVSRLVEWHLRTRSNTAK